MIGGGSMILSLIGINISPDNERFFLRERIVVLRDFILGLARRQRSVKPWLLKHVKEHLPWY